jgi:hypothetical protein
MSRLLHVEINFTNKNDLLKLFFIIIIKSNRNVRCGKFIIYFYIRFLSSIEVKLYILYVCKYILHIILNYM